MLGFAHKLWGSSVLGQKAVQHGRLCLKEWTSDPILETVTNTSSACQTIEEPAACGTVAAWPAGPFHSGSRSGQSVQRIIASLQVSKAVNLAMLPAANELVNSQLL